jgi:putative 7-cyano-7-deazaguanosine (preQ0) biosynthesis protein queE
MTMKVVEKFISINGEGQRAGELAVFIRFQGCNLRCSYCDTMWANEADCPYTDESTKEIVNFVLQSQIKNVTLTGGEPLLQPEMKNLLMEFAKHPQIRVEIETNGAIDLKPFTATSFRPSFTMDYKLPSSLYESKMHLENFAYLNDQDTVKFVAGSKADLDVALDIIQKYDLTHHCKVYLSPIFGKIEPVEMVNFMIAHQLNDVRLQIQIHKVIWDPDQKGV